MNWLWVALATGAAVMIFALATRGSRMSAPRCGSAGSDPISGDQISIEVEGWERGELKQIIEDFCRDYALHLDAVRLEMISRSIATLHFPQGIAADTFLYLVNYIHYPRGLDLTGRTVFAIGRAVSAASLGLLLTGADDGATFYVPADDRAYDEIYARLTGQRYYRLSFGDMYWIATTDARLPERLTISG